MKLHKFRSLAPANTAIAAAVLASSTCISAAVLPPELNWSTVSAETSLQDLAYQLIDLDPNDGITPQITFSLDAQYLIVQDGFDGAGNYLYEILYRPADSTLPLFDADTLLISPPGGSFVSTSAASVHTGVRASEELIDQLAIPPASTPAGGFPTLGSSELSAPADWVYVSYGLGTLGTRRLVTTYPSSGGLLNPVGDEGHYALNDSVGLDPYSFSLTPNTQVVFTGVLSSQARLDVSQWGAYDAQTMEALVRTTGSVALFAVAANDGNTSWMSLEEAIAAVEGQVVNTSTSITRFNFDPTLLYGQETPVEVVGPETTFIERQDTKTFELIFANQTLQSKTGFLTINTEAYIDMTGTAPVPEPSTYALMGLGLLGVLGAARRRQV